MLQHQYVCTHVTVLLDSEADASVLVYTYAVYFMYMKAKWPLLYVNVCRCTYEPLQFFKQAGIPGPKPKPFIGNMDLFRKLDVCTVCCHSFPLCLICVTAIVSTCEPD